MATKTAFPPEVMAALRTQTKFAQQAKKSVSQFASFSGPPARYFARFQRISLTFSKKDGSAIFNCFHTCLASCPDSSSDTSIPDQSYAGLPMRNSLRTAAGPKSTKQEAWERAMVGLQAYGIKTRNFGVRDGQEVQDDGVTFWNDCRDAIDLLNDKRPAVIIDVTESEDKKYKNCNVRDLVDEEVVEKFAKADFTISDEDMAIPDDEEADDGATPSSSDAVPSLADALASVSGWSDEDLVGALKEAEVKVGMPHESHTSEMLKAIAAAFLSKTVIPVYEARQAFGSGIGGQTMSNDRQTFALVPTSALVPISSDESDNDRTARLDAEAYRNDEEDDGPQADDEEDDSSEDKILKLQLSISILSREALKQAIRNAGGMRPDDKFKKSDSDEALRTILFDLKTGKTPPVSVVVPDDLTF